MTDKSIQKQREAFTFYRSYYEGIKRLPEDNQLEILKAIIDYSFTQQEQELSTINSAMFELMRPNLDNNYKQYLNGSKPKKANSKPIEAKRKPKLSQKKPTANNDNENDNDNKNENDNEKIKEVWNDFSNRIGLSPVIKLNETRNRNIKARSRDNDFNLQIIFDKIESSKFMQGDNQRGWRVDFDFVFCSAINYLKIMEGKYDDKKEETDDIDWNLTIEDVYGK
uniref:Terminase n=1 Tax=uncultured marine virus TaxID=186617 RepID=A0A0F7L3F7_9VIRU|nr:terminase [uncultured marine virus]